MGPMGGQNHGESISVTLRAAEWFWLRHPRAMAIFQGFATKILRQPSE
jgi:hypothetical protein